MCIGKYNTTISPKKAEGQSRSEKGVSMGPGHLHSVPIIDKYINGTISNKYALYIIGFQNQIITNVFF